MGNWRIWLVVVVLATLVECQGEDEGNGEECGDAGFCPYAGYVCAYPGVCVDDSGCPICREYTLDWCCNEDRNGVYCLFEHKPRSDEGQSYAYRAEYPEWTLEQAEEHAEGMCCKSWRPSPCGLELPDEQD